MNIYRNILLSLYCKNIEFNSYLGNIYIFGFIQSLDMYNIYGGKINIISFSKLIIFDNNITIFSLNTNGGILIYGKYGIIINKNIINYNAKLIFKILFCNIKNYHQYQLLHMVLIVILYLIIIIIQIHHY